MTSPRARRPRNALYVAASLLLLPLLPVAWLLTMHTADHTLLVVDNLGELLYAVVAACSCAWQARRSSGRLRQVWGALAAACTAWAAGQALWSWYELRGFEPFPTAADAGFLVFPLAACAALWLYPSEGGSRHRRRLLMDAVTVTASLALISWATALGAVAQAGAEDTWTFVVALAYPVGDLAVLTMCLIRLSTKHRSRGALLLLTAGLTSFTVADSSFAYLVALGREVPPVVSLGWWAGLALIATAPFAAAETSEEDRDEVFSAHVSFLPYVPVAAAAVVLLTSGAVGRRLGPVDVVLFVLVVALVVVRQFLTMAQNAHLVGALAAREADLRHAAFHDGLTGLANRALFHDRVSHALDLHRRNLRPLAVLFCDLDDFKLVNDTLGHGAGDELLVRVAERLQGSLRPGDTLARLGGDEFAVLLEDGGEAVVVAANMIAALQAPFSVTTHRLPVRGSIGVTIVAAEAATPTIDTLLSQADTAMYAAKRGGRGELRLFEPGMSLVEAADASYAEGLLAALTGRTLGVVYQPISDLDSGRVVGVEALARWTYHDESVPPSTFVPVAERAGLTGLLTDVVLEAALGQLARWNALLGHSRLTMAVNVSPQQFGDRTLIERVQAALVRAGVPARQLVLEMTETALLADPALAREITARLRRLGVHLSLDDFGVGYSSLVHLHQVELDSLKIDRGFIADLADETQTRFVKALLALGRDLGLEVIAEGVETQDQLERLKGLGCRLAQGFLLGRPATPDVLLPQLRDGLPAVLSEPAPHSPRPAGTPRGALERP